MVALSKLLYIFQKIRNFSHERRDLNLIHSSKLFDADWYLSNNPDISEAKIDPAKHYLHYGGFEGRNPCPAFYSAFYLDAYPDVKNAHINPLIHYLRHGETEGRIAQPKYRCPVCLIRVSHFLPISKYWEENRSKYGYPYTFDDLETMNAKQYTCPACGSVDRDRLYALYISKVMEQNLSSRKYTLLDIAPSTPLKDFLNKFSTIQYQSADKYMKGVDMIVDITDMHNLNSESYDIFICSHVLEHVDNDKKALSELFRILKPGGFGILMVPLVLKNQQIDEDPTVMDIGTRWRRFGQDDHVRLYSKTVFLERIHSAGFVVKQYGVEFFGKDLLIECGISLKSILYLAFRN